MPLNRFKILERLYAFETSTIQQISDAIRSAMSNVEYLLEEMMREGLVTCDQTTYSITPAGREVYMTEARTRR